MGLPELFFHRTPQFKGKDRLAQRWIRAQRGRIVTKSLPGGARVTLDLGIPYEASVWLERYERRELAVLQALLSPGDVFVDGGANVGVWSLVAASKVGETGRVHAFEPNPAVFSKLARNIHASGFEGRVIAHEAALADRGGNVQFLPEELHDMSRVVDEPHLGGITIQAVRLDDVVSDRPVAGVKLDVEGFELSALAGGEAILAEDRPWVCVELNVTLAGVSCLADWPVHKKLRQLDYVPCLVEDAFSGAESRLSDAWTSSLGHCNLLYSQR